MAGVIYKRRPKRKIRSTKEVTSAVEPTLALVGSAREEWLRQLRAQYTPAVSRQTLMVNEAFPVYGRS